MDVFEALHTRRSVRKFEDRPVPEELVEKILAAAMAAPSACNAQPWQFVVFTERRLLDEIPKINAHAAMAAHAPLAILVCGDTSLEISPGYWPVDCSAAVQNLLLAVHGLGLGAVWTGVYPQRERVAAFGHLLGLPKHVVAHSLIVVGYPAEQPAHENRYRPDRIHRDAW